MQNSLEQTPLPDNLVVSTTALLCLAVLPHALNIRVEILALFMLFAAWRLAALRVNWVGLNRWILYTFATLGFAVAAWLYGPPVGRNPGIAFLLVMLGLKVIETKTRRDIRMVLLLGYFTTLTHFLYHGDLLMVVSMLALVFGFTWQMMQMGHLHPAPRRLSDLRLSAKMFLQALPFALILFFLFPRLAGSLWLLQLDGTEGISGLSDKLSMGSVSRLIESDARAFTATFAEARVPTKGERYWRAAVLWDTNGRVWVEGRPLRRTPSRLQALGKPYQYDVIVETNTQNWLLGLDIPTSVPQAARRQADDKLTYPEAAAPLRRYTLTSASEYLSTTMNAELRQRGLALPPGVETARLSALVAELRAERDDAAYAQAVLDYFNQNEFVYTLEPPLLTSEQPVDEFMFDARRGFCGHYASSFVTLMRMGGVPARLVVGYLGGELNPRINQIVVTQAEAHAWVEVWLGERGWSRVDPTAFIAPERVENTIDYARSSQFGGVVRFTPPVSSGVAELVRQSRWLLDAVKLHWQRWFIGFDAKQQRALLKKFGLDNLRLTHLAPLAFVLGLLVLSGVAFLLFRAERHKIDAVQQIYLALCRKAARRGLTRAPYEGPMDFYHRLKTAFPDAAKNLNHIIQQYIKLRYARRSRSSVTTFRQAVRRLKF